ncbi:MAG: glycosyltransferase family 39 protein [Prevotellaceae bacterium]|nr:glycosyltransferase family 39 protein [Prevotellaceae bacterium]
MHVKKSQRQSSAGAPAKVKPTAPTRSLNIDDKRWRRILAALSGVTLLALLFVATQSGATGDEMLDGNNGKYYLKYYTEGDTSFANYPQNAPEVRLPFFQKYYGGGYEMLPAIAVKYFGLSQHEFLIRHLLCALFGFVFMLFAALTARELKDSLLACIALLVMALTPVVFGWSMFETKDIPHAAGYAIAVFAFVRILKKLPRLTWQDAAMAIVGIALATSIRIGGLLLVGYLGVGALLAVAIKKSLREKLLRKPYAALCKVILALGGVTIAGSLLGLCFYPNFFYEGPVAHVKNALFLVSKFPQRIPMLWEGRQIDSLNLPDGYLMKSFAMTIPVFALGGFFLFFCNIRRVWKTMDRASVLLLLFTIFFPIAYVLYTNASLYNFWRHLTFIYSSFAVVAAAGIYETLFWVKKAKYAKVWRCAFSGAVAILMATVLAWMVRNYKYTYAYFNVFVPKPYMSYDLDYFETSIIPALEWLIKNELKNRDDTVKIGAKNANAIAYAKTKQYGNVNVEQISFRNFAEANVDYAILNLQFIPPNVLKTSFPPKGAIHTEAVDGKPICTVVKKNKLDSRGIQAVRAGRISEGMKLLEEAGAYDPTNFGIWFWMGYGYFQQQAYDKAIRFFTSYLNFWPHPNQIGFAKMYIGASQVNLQQLDAGIQTLQEAAPLVKDEGNKKFIDANLGIAYFNKREYEQAVSYMKNAVDAYPHLNAFIAQAHSQMRLPLTAQK